MNIINAMVSFTEPLAWHDADTDTVLLAQAPKSLVTSLNDCVDIGNALVHLKVPPVSCVANAGTSTIKVMWHL